MSLTVRYSCHACGIEKAEVPVRYRSSSEEVLDWMLQVLTPALLADHDSRSPHCRPEGLDDVMIPITGAQYIGGPCLQ